MGQHAARVQAAAGQRRHRCGHRPGVHRPSYQRWARPQCRASNHSMADTLTARPGNAGAQDAAKPCPERGGDGSRRRWGRHGRPSPSEGPEPGEVPVPHAPSSPLWTYSWSVQRRASQAAGQVATTGASRQADTARQRRPVSLPNQVAARLWGGLTMAWLPPRSSSHRPWRQSTPPPPPPPHRQRDLRRAGRRAVRFRPAGRFYKLTVRRYNDSRSRLKHWTIPTRLGAGACAISQLVKRR